MAGKMCNGEPRVRASKARNSVAYCEGRLANKQGLLSTDNPQPESGSEAHEAWRLGHLSWDTNPVLGPQRDCCADKLGGGWE